jgi:branched-chain amino acid transport system substrate-binding protein
MINGVQMVVDKINASGGLLGRPVEFIVKDDQADPSQIPQAAAALKAEGVVAIIGTFMDNCNAALLQWGNDNNMLIGLADDTVVENRTTKFSKYAFFQCPLAPINGELLAQYAVNQLNINSFYSLRGDVFISKQVADSFAAEVQKLKPSVVNLGETVTGTTETDFTTSISAILAKKPDLVLLGEGGPSFVPFVQQAQQFQFFDKVKVATYLMLGAENTVSLTTNFPTGLAITMTAPFWLDTPEMKAYTKDFYDRTKLYPGELTMDFFMATLALTEAIKKAGTTDTDKVIAAWETLKLTDTPLGTVSYNDYDHQADSPIWIGVSGYSSDYPDIAIGLNLTKYQEGIYPTKDEILALRNAK